MSYPEFIENLKKLNLKKKGQRPKISPNKFYPHKVELQAIELLREELEDYCSRIQSAAFVGLTRDGVEEVVNTLGAVPDGFQERVDKLAREISVFNSLAFAEFSELTIGERYFPSSANQEDIINAWSENFVNLCKSANEEIRKKVASKVSDGVLGGKSIREIRDDVRNLCSSFSDNKAELIAITEVGKLNSAIERCQSEDVGLEYYEWSAAMDGRTRESHALMDGKICKWGMDDFYYEWNDDRTKLVKKDRTEKMYHGAPGTDFRCRCVALPYVPEYEDDYESEKERGTQRGVVQSNEQPKPMSTEHIHFLNEYNESRLTMAKSRKPYSRESNLVRKREKAEYELEMERDYQYLAKLPIDSDLNMDYTLWCRKNGSKNLNEYLKVKYLPNKNEVYRPIERYDMREQRMNSYIRTNPLKRDMVLWRSMLLDKKVYDSYESSGLINQPGIASFSKSMQHAFSFYVPYVRIKKDDKKKVPFVVRLFAKKGDHIAPPYQIKNGHMIGYPDESEFNAPSKSILRIKDKRTISGITIFDCMLED